MSKDDLMPRDKNGRYDPENYPGEVTLEVVTHDTEFEVAVATDIHGSVTATPAVGEDNLITYGTEVTLEAVPDSGYHFDTWTGLSPELLQVNPVTFTVVGAMSITCNFEAD